MRAMRIIFPHLKYADAVKDADISTLFDKRSTIKYNF